LLFAAGAVASFRAYYPVRQVSVKMSERVLRAGTQLQVDTRSSGRGPVDVRLELVQAGHSEMLALQRIRSRRWAFWDLRGVEHRMTSVCRREQLERFRSGSALLRATAIGAPAWLRQPPPVVQEIAIEVERD
jgi:hypothetical protein